MSASDHLGPQWYHGSSHAFEPGDMVEPGHPPTMGAGRADRSDHVYAASRPDIAGAYGKHTYRVEPTGPMHLDPELTAVWGGVPANPANRTHWRSASPMRVLGRED